MKLRLLSLCAALAVAAPALAEQGPPQPDARAYVVQNGATGELLAARAARDRVPVASITKLMTVMVALGRFGSDELVTVTPAAAIGESSANLRVGEQLSVEELAEAALIQSANDAAQALALHGDGGLARHLALMNEKARALGMHDTHFVNPTGLDEAGHVSSARDVTILARRAMQNATIRRIVRLRSETLPDGRPLHTWNDLLATFPGVIGVKTGHTSGAGWSQVAAARGRGFTIYATILGSPTRAQRNRDLTQLLAWGLSRYRVVAAVSPGRTYAMAAAPYGLPDVRLVAPRALGRVVRVERPLLERVVAPTAVELPVRKGQRLGRVEVWAGKRLVAESPLVAAATVEKPGTVGRARWYAGRTLRNAWGWFA